MKTVVLISGGLDSFLASELFPDAVLLFVNYGQPYAEREHEACKILYNEFEVAHIDLPLIKEQIFVPARNLLLASLAVQFGERIVIAGMKDDRVSDKNPIAFRDMSEILTRQSNKSIEVISPFWDKTKSEAVADYLASGKSQSRLLQTYSCYKDGEMPCLNCPACLRWFVTLKVNGLDVPRPKDEIIKLYLGKLHEYERHRQFTLLKAIENVIEVDIDGTLTAETEGIDYKNRTINSKMKQMVNNLSKNYYIVLHTSRYNRDRSVTEQWLRKNGVNYHALLMEKIPYKLIIDDKAVI